MWTYIVLAETQDEPILFVKLPPPISKDPEDHRVDHAM
jgi:hypothetical protein